jgi:hypothetical protein
MNRLPSFIIVVLLAFIAFGSVPVQNGPPSPSADGHAQQSMSTANQIQRLPSHPSTDPGFWKRIESINPDPEFWKEPTINPKVLPDITE